jgi:hypothetical protein
MRLAFGAALLALCAALGGAAPAIAASYSVDTCAGGSQPGWEPVTVGAWSSAWSDGCRGDGAGLEASMAGGALSRAGWDFRAPVDTEIAGFTVTRSYVLAAGRPFAGTTEFWLHTSGPGVGYERVHGNYGAVFYSGVGTESADGLTGQQVLSAFVRCGDGSNCTGTSSVAIYAARIDLRDDVAPVISAVTGSLVATRPVSGRRTLSYAASDRGGGLLREQLLVDGVARIDRPVDPSRCTAEPFAALVPCPLSASDTLELDTRTLANGSHEVELVVWDATGVNRARSGPIPVVVDNPPATASPTPVPTASPTPVPTTSPAPTAAASPATASPPAAEPAPRLSAAFESTGRTAATVRWGERPRIAGILQLPDGRPLSGATIALASRPALRSAIAVPLRPLITDAAGGFAFRLPTGVSRTVTLTARGAAASLSVRVIPRITLRITRASPPGGASRAAADGGMARATRGAEARAVVLSGRVAGAPPGLRKRVELQARVAGRWRTLTITRLARTGGSFHFRKRTRARAFRAVVRAEPGWPFLTGASVTTKG